MTWWESLNGLVLPDKTNLFRSVLGFHGINIEVNYLVLLSGWRSLRKIGGISVEEVYSGGPPYHGGRMA